MILLSGGRWAVAGGGRAWVPRGVTGALASSQWPGLTTVIRPLDDAQQQHQHDTEEISGRAQRRLARLARVAWAHRDGDLSHATPGPAGDDQGLDGVGQVFRRVVTREQLDRGAVVCAKARGDIGEPGPGSPGEVRRKQPHRPASQDRYADRAFAGKARTDDREGPIVVGTSVVAEGRQQPGDVPGVVLTVGVDLDEHPVPACLREPEPDA